MASPGHTSSPFGSAASMEKENTQERGKPTRTAQQLHAPSRALQQGDFLASPLAAPALPALDFTMGLNTRPEAPDPACAFDNSAAWPWATLLVLPTFSHRFVCWENNPVSLASCGGEQLCKEEVWDVFSNCQRQPERCFIYLPVFSCNTSPRKNIFGLWSYCKVRFSVLWGKVWQIMKAGFRAWVDSLMWDDSNCRVKILAKFYNHGVNFFAKKSKARMRIASKDCTVCGPHVWRALHSTHSCDINYFNKVRLRIIFVKPRSTDLFAITWYYHLIHKNSL